MNFNEFTKLIQDVDCPAQQLGVFRLEINNKGKKYDFHHLKENINLGDHSDLFSFGLNHYGYLHLPMPRYKRSQFHDREDVCVEILRQNFVEAIKEDDNKVFLKTKNWTATISWN